VQPQLSVIVPAWNAAGSLAACVGSILSDPADPFEVIVVDDASSDDTAAVATALAAEDPRIVVIRSPVNEGVSAARNRALDVARGTWLAFVDADDRVTPGGFAAMLRAADAHGSLAVVGQRISTDGVKRWFPALYELPDIRRPGTKSITGNPGLLYYAGPVGKLYHRSCAEGLRFEGRVLGDQPWVLRALLRAGDRIQVVDDVVYEWHRPRKDDYWPSITAEREGSAGLAADAVVMAGVAYRVVTGAWATLLPPAEREALDAAYLDRLIRADLGRQLWRAVSRGDPGTAALLAALGEFLGEIPPAVLARSESVVDRVVRPPATGFWRLTPDARDAWWTIVRTLSPARAPELAGLRHGIMASPAIRLGERTRSRRRQTAALALLWPHAVLSTGLAWLGRRRRTVVGPATGGPPAMDAGSD
jgi:hypothetical protein